MVNKTLTLLFIITICTIRTFTAFSANLTFTGDEGDFNVPFHYVGEVRMVDLVSLGQGFRYSPETDTVKKTCIWNISDSIHIKFTEKSAFVALPENVVQLTVEVQRDNNQYYAPLLGTLDLLSKLGFTLAYRPELDQVTYSRRTIEQSDDMKNQRDKWAFDVIVLDPGHGGKDPGAIGRKKTKEKNITLQVAKRLKPLLEKRLHVRVVMTRDRDVFVPLAERGKIANAAGGKLFVSIHCNASRNRKASGIETYFLAPARRERALEVALAENSVIKYEETTAEYPDLTDEGYILTAMAQGHFMKESEDLAGTIQEKTCQALNLPNRGVDQAGFYVLIGASMPAILFEMGFISHRKEEMLLRSSEFQQELAEALYRSIEAFIQRHSGT
jgi:N-acetylmuramoyl-L-alanine amidase